jgi:hypothetical protein
MGGGWLGSGSEESAGSMGMGVDGDIKGGEAPATPTATAPATAGGTEVPDDDVSGWFGVVLLEWPWDVIANFVC